MRYLRTPYLLFFLRSWRDADILMLCSVVSAPSGLLLRDTISDNHYHYVCLSSNRVNLSLYTFSRSFHEAYIPFKCFQDIMIALIKQSGIPTFHISQGTVIIDVNEKREVCSPVSTYVTFVSRLLHWLAWIITTSREKTITLMEGKIAQIWSSCL